MVEHAVGSYLHAVIHARLVLADADPLRRSLLRALCQGRGFAVVGEARDVAELVELALEQQPDLVVTDADLDDGPVEQAVATTAAAGIRTLVVCDVPAADRLASLLDAGADGVMSFDASPVQLIDAIAAVAKGSNPLAPEVAAVLLTQWRWLRRGGGGGRRDGQNLTEREHDILVAMVEGLAAKAVASRLGISVKTVENHKIRIFDKLGARNHAHAVSLAITNGLVPGRTGR